MRRDGWRGQLVRRGLKTDQLASIITPVKTLGIFEIKTRLSRICEEVAQTGESVLVTRRGRPLVRIDPLSHETAGHSPVWEARQRHEAEYGVHEDLPHVDRRPEGIHNPFDEGDA